MNTKYKLFKIKELDKWNLFFNMFKNNSSLNNLGSIAIFMLIYFLRVILYMVLFFINRIFGSCAKRTKNLGKKLFFE